MQTVFGIRDILERIRIRRSIPLTNGFGSGSDSLLRAVLRIRIRDPVPFWPLDPGPGIGFFRIPDPGSQIHIFESLLTIFWVKSSIILWKLAQIFFFSISKLKNVQFCEIFGYVKSYDNKFFFTPLFCCCFWIRDPRSGILDPGSGMGKIQDPGSGINSPDPQHWLRGLKDAKNC